MPCGGPTAFACYAQITQAVGAIECMVFQVLYLVVDKMGPSYQSPQDS